MRKWSVFVSIDPPTVQQAALAWLGVFTVVATAALSAVIALWPKVSQLRQMMVEHQTAIQTNNIAIRKIDPTAASVTPLGAGPASSVPSIAIVPGKTQEPPV